MIILRVCDARRDHDRSCCLEYGYSKLSGRTRCLRRCSPRRHPDDNTMGQSPNRQSIEMPGDGSRPKLAEALDRGSLRGAVLDEIQRLVWALFDELGIEARPAVDDGLLEMGLTLVQLEDLSFLVEDIFGVLLEDKDVRPSEFGTIRTISDIVVGACVRSRAG